MLTTDELKWLDENENRKTSLGQVFTPDDVAEMMVSMVLDSIPATILDPCFGKGVFLKLMNNKVKDEHTKLIGIEVDPDLYQKVKEELPDVELYHGDFFDFDKEVDCIIMNPPYIRQELLKEDMPKFLNKDEIISRLPLINSSISSRSNLYIYFFIKSWDLLKTDGEIVAIVPNTWMTADYGESFKTFLLNNFWIKSIIQFNKDVFPNADVDSCIIHLKKDVESSERPTNLVKINKKISKDELTRINQLIEDGNEKLPCNNVSYVTLLEETNWLLLFNDKTLFNLGNNFTHLEKLVTIKRGITTNYNKFFITNKVEMVELYPDYFVEIVCSPKEVLGYTTKSISEPNYLFATQDKKEELPMELRGYVETFEKEILKDERPVTMFNKIGKDPNRWFNIKNLTTAPILFSYIVRDRKRFILNEANYVSRDNFYELTPKGKIDKYVLFAILNSRITSLFLEDIGRSHGKGMLKIQKYELERLQVVNPEVLSEQDLEHLVKLGIGLSTSKEQDALDYISEIDRILLPYVSTQLSVEELEQSLKEKMKSRSDRKSGHLKLVKE